MKSWYQEDWEFKIAVLAVGKDNKATNCRMGYEPEDSFTCQYGCPQDFCSKSMLKVFPILEAVRSDGDLRNLGGSGKHEMEIVCPDGVVKFRISAKRIWQKGLAPLEPALQQLRSPWSDRAECVLDRIHSRSSDCASHASLQIRTLSPGRA